MEGEIIRVRSKNYYSHAGRKDEHMQEKKRRLQEKKIRFVQINTNRSLLRGEDLKC